MITEADIDKAAATILTAWKLPHGGFSEAFVRALLWAAVRRAGWTVAA